jgi:hypothetical protein
VGRWWNWICFRWWRRCWWIIDYLIQLLCQASTSSLAGLPVSVQGYPITVGSGGAGGIPDGGSGNNGNNSVFSTITSAGGGGGTNE